MIPEITLKLIFWSDFVNRHTVLGLFYYHRTILPVFSVTSIFIFPFLSSSFFASFHLSCLRTTLTLFPYIFILFFYLAYPTLFRSLPVLLSLSLTCFFLCSICAHILLPPYTCTILPVLKLFFVKKKKMFFIYYISTYKSSQLFLSTYLPLKNKYISIEQLWTMSVSLCCSECLNERAYLQNNQADVADFWRS